VTETIEGIEPLEGVVFDMDGVVTRTAHLHRAAWRQLFDDFFGRRLSHPGEDHGPFTDADYRLHVDGRPRQEGVRAFLGSRGILLPDGSSDDPPYANTVLALARRKNAIFRHLTESTRIEADEGVVRLARALREAGVAVGIATSSRNAERILERAGVAPLFGARVDGVVSDELGLRGKPEPDIFLECAARLGVTSPARAAVIEDSETGVRAARAGGFGLVVGVDRGGNMLQLRRAGADVIVRDTNELAFDGFMRHWCGRSQAQPNALSHWDRLATGLAGSRIALFLDYDGTLTPIVDRPEQAVLSPSMRDVLLRVARVWPTHVISGRDLDDIRRLVGIDSLWYAGSHGFDIAPPEGSPGGYRVAAEFEPEIHIAASELAEATRRHSGVIVEDKRSSISVHFRLADEAIIPELEKMVDDAVSRHPSLTKTYGKKVVQLQPAMDWDKGKALSWLLDRTANGEAYPIYVGDDLTDEDAFVAIRDLGLGIIVTDAARPTAARYSLSCPLEVEGFLECLVELGERNR
jgi:trehalose 6-phosphate phosphatase